jgi:hypothetical protein
LDDDLVGGEVGDCPAEEPDAGGAFLVVEDLDVGEAGGVVDGDVAVLPADPPVRVSGASADGAVTGTLKRPSFLMSMWMSSPAWRRQ